MLWYFSSRYGRSESKKSVSSVGGSVVTVGKEVGGAGTLVVFRLRRVRSRWPWAVATGFGGLAAIILAVMRGYVLNQLFFTAFNSVDTAG